MESLPVYCQGHGKGVCRRDRDDEGGKEGLWGGVVGHGRDQGEGRNKRYTLVSANNVGRYQVLSLVMSMIAFSSEGYLTYALTFLLLAPSYVCVRNGVQFDCDAE